MQKRKKLTPDISVACMGTHLKEDGNELPKLHLGFLQAWSKVAYSIRALKILDFGKDSREAN